MVPPLSNPAVPGSIPGGRATSVAAQTPCEWVYSPKGRDLAGDRADDGMAADGRGGMAAYGSDAPIEKQRAALEDLARVYEAEKVAREGSGT